VRFFSVALNTIYADDKQPVGYRFFLAMSSSDGLLWANGPMQVGGLGSTNCLVPGTMFVPIHF